MPSSPTGNPSILSAVKPVIPLMRMPDRAESPFSASDPRWTQIHANLATICHALRFNPRRSDTLRDFESTLRLQAAYSAAQRLDARALRTLADHVDAGERQQIIEQAVIRNQPHHREQGLRALLQDFDAGLLRYNVISTEVIDAAIDDMLASGYTPTLLATANLVWYFHKRDAAERRDTFQPAMWNSNFDSLRRVVDPLTAQTALVGGLAHFDATLTPVYDALTLDLCIIETLCAPLDPQGDMGNT